MNKPTQILIVALVIIATLLGIFRTPAVQMGIAVAAIGLALFFANLDKFKSFKAAGVEAELRTVVDKAYAAIEQLKDLGLALSAPIIDQLAVSGRMLQYIPLRHKLARVEKVAETLKNLGASPKEIEEACSTIYERVANDHLKGVLYNLRSSNPEKKLLFEGLDDGKMDNFDMSKLGNFITENNLNKSAETDECILDYDHFFKNKKLRREDKWQS